MNQERPVVYLCAGETTVGIVHDAAGTTGVLMIVGGPQVRAGSHRLYVLQARQMARLGLPVFRFDARGMGDSSGELPGFEGMTPDIVDALLQFRASCPQVREVVLWGLCDGASAALLSLPQLAEHGVCGLCLVNPWVRTPESEARTQVRHYYFDRLRQRAFWQRLFSGQVAVGTLSQAWKALRKARHARALDASPQAFPARMARAWEQFDGAVLLVLSENDYTAREFVDTLQSDSEWRGALNHPMLTRLDVAGADHTFSSIQASRALSDGFAQWIRRSLLEDAGLRAVEA